MCVASCRSWSVGRHGRGSEPGARHPLPVAYAYDDRDRLLIENAVTYTWDADGNQTGKTGPDGATYEWDYENRLTRVTLADGTTVDHTYDADGTRVRTVTTPAGQPSQTVDYLVDPWHQTSAAGRTLVLSQVVAETDGAGALTAYHVRGDDLLATLRPDQGTPGAWIPRYFHAEAIGTIRALTDEAGLVTDRYTLEAFGTLLDHQGDDPNAYLFAGELVDSATGLLSLRSRWLDNATGRFASVDPLGGRQGSPLHAYLYSSASPLDNTDPTGLWDLPQAMIVGAIGGLVTGAIIGYIQGGVEGSIVGAVGGVVAGAAFPAVAFGLGNLAALLLGVSAEAATPHSPR